MHKRIALLRVAYWLGAVLDGLTIVPLLSHRAGAKMFGMAHFTPGPDYDDAITLAAALVLGWTALLLWADHKPVDRRGVLPLTVLVIVGLALAGARAVASGLLSFEHMLPTWIWQALLSALFLFAYRRSRIPLSG